MASVKAVLKNNIYKDGTSPIFIRVTSEGKTSYKTLGTNIPPKYWDAKKSRVRDSYRLAAVINQAILKKIAELETQLIQKTSRGDYISPKTILREKKKNTPLLLELLQIYIDNCEDYCMRQNIKAIIGKLVAFGANSTTLQEIDEDWILKFESYLKHVAKNKQNTISNRMAKLSTVMNLAVKKDYIVKNPFIHYHFKKESTVKQKLSPKELEALAVLDLAKFPRLALTRDIFLLGIYLRGMRISDLLQLKKTDISDGRLLYKTSKDKDTHDLKLIPQALEIIGRMKSNTQYIIPLLNYTPNLKLDRKEEQERKYKAINSQASNMNYRLKKIAALAGIDKNISAHIARHTFASLLDKQGVRVTQIQKMLGHSSSDITDGYLNELRKADELDDVMDSVFNPKG